MDVRGDASDASEAGELLTNIGLQFVPLIAFASNAAVNWPEIELVYDATPGVEEHEFLQSFVPDPPLTWYPGRRVDMDVLSALVGVLDTHPERARLCRSIGRYAEALQTWRGGEEIACVANLYMGFEALTVAALRQHMAETDKGQDQLLAEWGLTDKRRLESEARRRILFQGDEECHRRAKHVSDGLEHGFLDYGEMRKVGAAIVVKLASYLRSGVFSISGLDPALSNRALADPFRRPRGPLALVRYVRGTLVGKAEELAAPGQEHPFMEWRSRIKSVEPDGDERSRMIPADQLTARIGAGIQFWPRRYEAWDGSLIKEPSLVDEVVRGTDHPS